MQPLAAANGSSTPSQGQKRPAAGRVRPAIPFALTKPRPTNKTSKVHDVVERVVWEEKSVEADVTSVSQGNDVEENDKTQQQQRPRTNGGGVAAPSPKPSSPAISQVVDVQTPPIASTPVIDDRKDTPPPATNGATLISGLQSPISNASNTAKSTDRFDLQPIRTELPPAFVPATDQQTPLSASSSTRRTPQAFGTIDGHKPNGNGIVFGGYNPADTSQAPPQPADSAFPPAPQNAPRSQPPPPPTYTAGGLTHSHGAAKRSVNGGFPPPAPPYNGRPFSNGHQSRPSYASTAGSAFRYPPREVFTPIERHTPHGPPSRPQSMSRTSSPAARLSSDLQSPITGQMDHNMNHRSVFDGRQPNMHHQSGGSIPYNVPHPDAASTWENAESMREHVLASLSNPRFADCRLHISDDQSGQPYVLDAHQLILSRSPRLLGILLNGAQTSSTSGKVDIAVNVVGDYVRIAALLEAIKHLYGGPLLSYEQLRLFYQDSDPASADEQRFQAALEYCASASWLGLAVAATRGLDLASNLLHWGTVTKALTFALDGGLHPSWSVDDASEDRISCSSSDDSLGRPEMASTPTYDPYATTLLRRILLFVVQFFPYDFYLDAAAAALDFCPRLPTRSVNLHASRSSGSQPRLSQIRFGEMAADDLSRPSFVTTTISSILLCLPFALLKYTLEHFELAIRLGPETVGSIMRQVVGEREARRMRCLKERTPADLVGGGRDAHLTQNLYWEEMVEASNVHRAGLRLTRRRRGIDTPPSSGAASERSK